VLSVVVSHHGIAIGVKRAIQGVWAFAESNFICVVTVLSIANAVRVTVADVGVIFFADLAK
jgi:hypothetical protein